MVVVKKEMDTEGRDRHDKAATGEDDRRGPEHTGQGDEEFEKAALSLNGMRNAYLAENRSCGGIDRLLIKLMQAKYRCAPAR